MKNIQSFRQFNAGNLVQEMDAQQVPPIQQPDINTYKDKLLNLIPSEVIATYVSISSLIIAYQGPIQENTLHTVEWVFFICMFVLNPLYNYKVSGVRNTTQLIISTVGFGIWVLAIGGPFLSLGLDENLIHLLGGIILILYTFLIPIFIKPQQV